MCGETIARTPRCAREGGRHPEEGKIMRRLLILGASALLFTAVIADEALAQKKGGFGGFGGGGFGGGGFRGGGFGGGFRGPAMGAGFRGAAIGGPRFAAGGWRGGPAWSGQRLGWGGRGWAGRGVAWGGGPRWHRGGYWNRGWGWGVPVAAGLAFAAASSYPYDDCLRWNGWRWVNVCYAPAYYGGYGPAWAW
jgi:hypothetical protein